MSKQSFFLAGALLLIGLASWYLSRDNGGSAELNNSDVTSNNPSLPGIESHPQTTSNEVASKVATARGNLMTPTTRTLNQLNKRRATTVVEALDFFKQSVLQDIEFRNSELLWDGVYEDRVVRLYSLSSPSKLDRAEAESEIDHIIADSSLNLQERRIFAKYAERTLRDFLLPEGVSATLFFNMPTNPELNVFVDRNLGVKNSASIVKALEESEGMEYEGGGTGEGEFRIVERVEAGWRYSRFLSLVDQPDD